MEVRNAEAKAGELLAKSGKCGARARINEGDGIIVAKQGTGNGAWMASPVKIEGERVHHELGQCSA